jgi:hypothetical protein
MNDDLLKRLIDLLDEAMTIIYNMEGDIFQANYEKLETILNSLKQTEV